MEAAQLETISQFGTESINHTFVFPVDQKNANRLEAIERLCDKLEQIIASTAFSIGKKDLPALKHLEDKIAQAKRVIPSIATQTMNPTTGMQKIVINEKNFSMIHQSLRNIRRDLTSILDKNDLIFSSTDDWDEESLMRAWTEEG